MAERQQRWKKNLTMDKELWILLDRFHTVLNDRCREKGWPRVTLARVTGAILANFLLAHESDILEEITRRRLERILRRVGRSLPKADFDTILAAGASEDASFGRVGSRDQSSEAH